VVVFSEECPIFHEFGLGVDRVNQDYSDDVYVERFGDALAILFTRSSCYGRGTRRNMTTGTYFCNRSADKDVEWPGTGLREYQREKIYSGFVWELTQGLLAAGRSEDEAYSIAKRLVLGPAVENPMDIQHAVELSLDHDDDGDLSNGTPNLAAIKGAATKGPWKPEWGALTGEGM
jgi:hypothetical protein